jgi:hypothetical protein
MSTQMPATLRGAHTLTIKRYGRYWAVYVRRESGM